MDLALRKLLKQYPNLLLIGMEGEESKSNDKDGEGENTEQQEYERIHAESEHEAEMVPPSTKHAISTILRFLSALLRNAYNKIVFNSVQEITNLLAAADDEIASEALKVLSSLAIPVDIHRLGVPDISHNTTALHDSKSPTTFSRLIMLSKGWGSKGSGLGLATVVTTDDSHSGQGILPEYGGVVRYEFLPPSSNNVVSIQLSSKDICLNGHSSNVLHGTDEGNADYQVEKKRKTSPAAHVGGPASKETKSTSHLFFRCLEQIGGRKNITSERLFDLLVHIRLAKFFHSRATRILAVESRLHALLTLLYAYQSHETLYGYFHAQPELCAELTDLIHPTVSQSAVSSSQSKLMHSGEKNESETGVISKLKEAAIESIVLSSASIPFKLRSLAVEVLTALVMRKDDPGSNGMSQLAKQVTVLNELGVGKGQFLGLLPTLIRYSLASLKSIIIDTVSRNKDDNAMDVDEDFDHQKNQDISAEDDLGLELGLAFVNVTKPKLQMGKIDAEEKAMEFISCVLCLTYAVVSSSSGTSSLTDCGLIPALVSTISLYDQVDNTALGVMMPERRNYLQALFKFIMTQSILILEGAISNHAQALSAFHELNGLEILLQTLYTTIERIESSETKSVSLSPIAKNPNLQGPDRVLLNGTLHCLTVILQLQESSPRSASFSLTPSAVLKKKEMTGVLIKIMNNVSMYCGTLASLAITFLGDVMNSDPRVVHYVFQSGLADAFMLMIKSKSVVLAEQYGSWYEPNIPPSQELIVAIPNVITALALTEEGRNKIANVFNPFPDILAILCSPQFAMPISRCMASDVPAMIGGSLDEMMRHVPSLKEQMLSSIVNFIRRVVYIGEKLIQNELEHEKTGESTLNIERIQFMQYANNVIQIVEQLLQNDDHCEPFADAGGVIELLRMHPLLMLSGQQFLAHISTQSSPSVAILSHSTTAVSITAAIRRVASNYNGTKILTIVKEHMMSSLDTFEKCAAEFRKSSKSEKIAAPCFDENDNLNLSGILESVPNVPLHILQETEDGKVALNELSSLMRHVINIEWISQILSSIVRTCLHSDNGLRGRTKWHEEVTSTEFQSLIERISLLHRSALYEVCRIRSAKDFDDNNDKRWLASGDCNCHPALYKLRIVCSEGAIVRDGIDIDSCASVGSLEMGEEVVAFDRCVNGSGILRYKTAKGWVSEQTRGHGREPISEVYEISGIAPKRSVPLTKDPKTTEAIEFGIPDLCASCASILSRLHNSQSFLYTSLSRSVVVAFKSIANRPTTMNEKLSRSHVGKLIQLVSNLLRRNFELKVNSTTPNGAYLNEGGRALFLGNMLNLLHCCIYEERREKQILNVLIFCNILIHDDLSEAFFIPDLENLEKVENQLTIGKIPDSGFYDAIRFVLRYGIADMKTLCISQTQTPDTPLRQSKIVASSFPSALSLLRRLTSQSLLIDNAVGGFLQKMEGEEFLMFLAGDFVERGSFLKNKIFSFRQQAFARYVHCTIGLIAEELWSDQNIKFAPAHVLNPIASLVNEVFISLDNSCNDTVDENEERKTGIGLRQPLFATRSRSRRPPVLNDASQRNQHTEENENEEHFRPSPETIQRMIEMGFSRTHAQQAIESSQSNVLEVAMEYALSHPPSAEVQISEEGASLSQHNSELVESAHSESEVNTGVDDQVQSEVKSDETAVTDGSQKLTKELTAEQLREETEKRFDKLSLKLVKRCTKNLIDCIVNNSTNMIQGPTIDLKINASSVANDFQIVVCSLLLNVSKRYPAERHRILDQAIQCMFNKLEKDAKGNHTVIDGNDQSFASICHALVLILRAIPRLRILVLKKNVMSTLLQCLKGFCSKLKHTRDRKQSLWPSWLAPCILIFDIMAEPMSLEEDKDSTDKNSSNSRTDWNRVYAEHKRQQGTLTKVSKRISSTIDKTKPSITKSKNKEAKQDNSSNEEKTDLNATTTTTSSTDSSNEVSPLSNIPAYSPLLNHDMAESLLTLSLQLSRHQQGKKENIEKNEFFIPPSVMHAILLTLTKILRSQKLRSTCLRLGGTELILSIQRKSRFNGHSSLLALVFRRLIEDENTLQSIMESEIRSTVSKLQKKNSRSLNNDGKVVSVRLFVESALSLICRDPIIFLRAASTSIKLVPDPEKSTQQQYITVLTAEDRAKHIKSLSESFRLSISNSNPQIAGAKSSNTPMSKRGRQGKGSKQNVNKRQSKSPHRSSKKSQKKDKQDRLITIIGSTAHHVTSQLLTVFLRDFDFKQSTSEVSFISTSEYLEIIGDLILKIPACASVVHGFQPPKQISINHACLGCKTPQQNVVNFLLHHLLSLPRVSPTKDKDFEKLALTAKKEVTESYMKTKVSQNAARLLVILVARAGEGRKRVILELSNAIKADLNNEMAKKVTNANVDRAMWALQSWGELCIGLAAPRRNNSENESSMSFEVVRVMQECGMTHALMHGIQRIHLEHPLAAATAAALLRPLELFTRPAMIDTITIMAKKAEKKKTDSKTDDMVLGGVFDADASSSNVPWIYNNDTTEDPLVGPGEGIDNDVEMNDGFESVEDDSIIMSDEESEDESDTDDSMDSDEDSESEEDDDDESSNDDSDDEDQDMDGGDEDEIEIQEDGHIDHLDQLEIEDFPRLEMHVDDGDTDDDFLDGNEDIEEVEGNLPFDGELDGEGWTTIEAGFGNMFTSRNGSTLVGRPRNGTNNGGAFMIAENVIGNILRAGGLHMDALAEIEDTLGIRISTSRPSDNGRFGRVRAELEINPVAGREGTNSNNAENVSSSEPIGEVPNIMQRSPPESLFNSLGNNGRVPETNYMDYQYGGQPLGSGREFFDPSGTSYVISARDINSDDLQPPSTYEVQLFPRGATVSMQTRTSFVAHHLLAAINLPPLNSLLPNTQENAHGHPLRSNNTFERNYTEIRLGRGGPITIFDRTHDNRSRRNLGGNLPIHGQSIGSTGADFGLAFQNALTSTILNTANISSSENAVDESSTTQRASQTSNVGSSSEAVGTGTNDDGNTSADQGNASREDNNSSSDGENVVSSLASALSLSNNESASNVETSNNSQDSNNGQPLMQSIVEESQGISNLDARNATNEDMIIDNDTNNNVQSEINAELNSNIGDGREDSATDEATNEATHESNNDQNNNDENQNDNDANNDCHDQITQENHAETSSDMNENAHDEENGASTLVCPPGVDAEVFAQLPIEMQQEIIQQHQATETVAAQLDATSGLDPEALAALPEEMRREIIEQEQNERRSRTQQEAPADPSNAEDMDNASFIASLAPDLRREILLTADDSVLNSLPPDIIAEAQILRERAASSRHRRDVMASESQENISRRFRSNQPPENTNASQPRPKKRSKTGKVRVDIDREYITYSPTNEDCHGPLLTSSSIKPLISLMFLLSPVRPQRLLQKLFQNFCANAKFRQVLIKAFLALLVDEPNHALAIIDAMDEINIDEINDKKKDSFDFPPSHLLGVSPDIDAGLESTNFNSFHRRRQGSSTTATSIASNLPLSSKCSTYMVSIPPVVARRIVGTLTFLSKNVLTSAVEMLGNFGDCEKLTNETCLDSLLGLLGTETYKQSSSNLEDLLTLVETTCAPLTTIPVDSDNLSEVPQKDIDAAKESGKVWIEVPRSIVSPEKLNLFCATLKLESCKDGIFVKVNTIAKRLSKIDANRDCILKNLACVAQSLGLDAVHDLRALRIRLNKAVKEHRHLLLSSKENVESNGKDIPSATVTLSTSSSELKLLRVLQSLLSLCSVASEDGSKRSDNISTVRQDFVPLVESLNLHPVWEQLTGCLRDVSILEGVSNSTDGNDEEIPNDDDDNSGKKLQNSVAGLLSRFLPTIEAFFVVHASIIKTTESKSNEMGEIEEDGQKLVGGQELVEFVSANKVLINALLRSSPSLLDKGLRAMVRIPSCTTFMDFDVKRHWFRSQVRRLRQNASRRHGSLRLSIRRQRVFEDAYHQLRLRNAEEMRGRLHITFVNEEGVDAGGLSREFFGILAKEMFNPNYALFTSTEDGCTFQPNPHSSINPDHLSYFQFVGRIVGKAVADGFLLDAHFTRSLYKHMLGLKVSGYMHLNVCIVT